MKRKHIYDYQISLQIFFVWSYLHYDFNKRSFSPGNRFFVGYGLELSRLIPLIMFNLKKKFLCKTESEVKEAWAPGDLNFATRVPNDMLIVTIVLCYSVIAPLIIPFGVLYFALGWIVARNQVCSISYSTPGRKL